MIPARTNKFRLSRRSLTTLFYVVALLLVGSIGLWMLRDSSASTPTASAELEKGTIQDAKTATAVNTTSASSGQAVWFSGPVGGITRTQTNAVFSRAATAYNASASTFLTTTASNGKFPNTTKKTDGTWNTTTVNAWTSGFLAGNYWMLYKQTNSNTWKDRALRATKGVEARASATNSHDIGFQLLPSYGLAYDLAPADSPTGTSSFKSVLTTAAGSLATRYNTTIKATRSWNNITGDKNYLYDTDFQVIVDNLMNLELFFKAADLNPGTTKATSWNTMGTQHTLTTGTYFFRPDDSTNHLVVFDTQTGKPRTQSPNGVFQPQAYSLDSTWARGQAWVIAGNVMAYKETKDKRFLDFAHRALKYYLANLPADSVPYWDFNAPVTDTTPRDSSAAAIVASYLLELSQLETDAVQKKQDILAAEKMIRSLMSSKYLSTSGHSLLLHGTVNARTCMSGETFDYSMAGCDADTGIIYGDYYFMQALHRYRALFP